MLNQQQSLAHSAGFPRCKRLLTSYDFRTVFRDGKRLKRASILVFYKPNGRAFSRLGFAIAKKQVKKAVARNRIKRLVRESFRKQTITPAVDIIVMVRQEVVERDNQTITLQLEKIWEKISEALIESS